LPHDPGEAVELVARVSLIVVAAALAEGIQRLPRDYRDGASTRH
jgi:hypothetical protein